MKISTTKFLLVVIMTYSNAGDYLQIRGLDGDEFSTKNRDNDPM